MANVVSEFDNLAYTRIRDSVTDFIKTQASIYDASSLKLLDIAPQIHAGAREFFKKSDVLTADIDPNSGADYIVDICRTNDTVIPPESFDIVVCTEVLEHTLKPFHAVDEIHRILKPGGVLLATTPFNFRIHGPLPDCWRFTEHGLRSLLANFEGVEIEQLEDETRFLMPLHYRTVAKKQTTT